MLLLVPPALATRLARLRARAATLAAALAARGAAATPYDYAGPGPFADASLCDTATSPSRTVNQNFRRRGSTLANTAR